MILCDVAVKVQYHLHISEVKPYCLKHQFDLMRDSCVVADRTQFVFTESISLKRLLDLFVVSCFMFTEMESA